MKATGHFVKVLCGGYAVRSSLEIGTNEKLETIGKVPSFLRIDREIGKPFSRNPVLFNSQAWSRKLELPWATSQVDPAPGMAILDVGSGVSALPQFMAEKGARVVSADPVASGLADRNAHVDRVRGALPRLPFKDMSFDIVCSVSVLEHLDIALDQVFRELFRVARTRVVLTFDVSMGPLAYYGVSRAELRGIGRMVGVVPSIPPHPLRPTGFEQADAGPHVGVALLSFDKPAVGWPRLRLTKTEKLHAGLQRILQRALWKIRSRRTRLRRIQR